MNNDFWVIDASCGSSEGNLWKEQSVSNEANSKLKHSWAGNFSAEFVNAEISSCMCPANCEKNHTKLLGLRYFNSSALSHTYVKQNLFGADSLDLTYVEGRVSGTLATDILTASSLKLGNVSFVIVNDMKFRRFRRLPFDGIMGLALQVRKRTYTSASMIDLLWEQLDEPVFSIYLKRRKNWIIHDHAGLITFGARDYRNCRSEWHYVPVADDSMLWKFSLSLFRIDSYQLFWQDFGWLGSSPNITIDYSRWMNVNSDAFSIIKTVLNATYFANQSRLVVNCENGVSHLPDIKFGINKIVYKIPAEDYIRAPQSGENNRANLISKDDTYDDIALPEGYCMVGVSNMDLQDKSFEKTWSIGMTFLYNYCAVFDIQNQRIGFAESVTKSK
ncbi:eukaryotic aspartyl protease domain-containing protein [Ditylenchus destructor]|nr:eukaryotic aspartyl protease domain-containing protein [Ditylenchus destructor]